MKAAVISGPSAGPEYGEFAEPHVEDGYELVDLVAAADSRDRCGRTQRVRRTHLHRFRQASLRHVCGAHGRSDRNADRAAARSGSGENRRRHQSGAIVVVVAQRACGRGAGARHGSHPRRNRNGRTARRSTFAPKHECLRASYEAVASASRAAERGLPRLPTL